MAFNQQEEAEVRDLLTAFRNGKRISDLEPAGSPGAGARIEVLCSDGESRRMELAAAVREADNPIAGRWWNEDNATPTAAGWFGSLEALQRLPYTLGLGRYLVTDDRVMRKLDPADSRKYEDGSPAKLDGSEGQCMWCWRVGWYYTTWKEGNRTYEAITLKPIEGRKSRYIPAGGVSWLGAGVMDRETGKLCSLISDDPRYRGGNGADDDSNGECEFAGTTAPQYTMLGMLATMMNTTEFGEAARLRGEGWEANWFAARTAVEILLRVIMGTRNSQADYCADKDADGLMQGGFGPGVTDFVDWCCCWPIVPTKFGAESGDFTGIIDFNFPPCSKVEHPETYTRTIHVPMFFGLVGAGFGHLDQFVRGLMIKVDQSATVIEIYVAPSLYGGYNPNAITGMKKVAESPLGNGYIKRISMDGLCAMPTETGGTEDTYYCDSVYTDSRPGLFVRAAGGNASWETCAGAAFTDVRYTASDAEAFCSSPLCFFTEDVIIR